MQKPQTGQHRKPGGPGVEAKTPRAGPMRIAKALARAGLCSRREAERWIEGGRVSVNGEVLKSPARDVSPADRIMVDGSPLPAPDPPRLWRYHKPKGRVTTHSDPQGRPTVFEALPEEMPRVISIGRLDFNTEGLLLLTNDGALARHLELPATGWLRRYRVRAHGAVTQEALDKLKGGIEIEGVRYGPIEAALEKVQGSNVWLMLGLREGKNREVRKILDTPRADGEPSDPHLLRAVPAARPGAWWRGARAAARHGRPARRGHRPRARPDGPGTRGRDEAAGKPKRGTPSGACARSGSARGQSSESFRPSWDLDCRSYRRRHPGPSPDPAVRKRRSALMMARQQVPG